MVLDNFIDLDNLRELLGGDPPGESEVLSAVEKAHKIEGLGLEDVAALVKAPREFTQGIQQEALGLKEVVFGKRIVLFAPLYLTNRCVNDCLYCGFRMSNTGRDRKTLTVSEAVTEADTLAQIGFKRILLVAGEYPSDGSSPEYISEVVAAIYENTLIRIIHLNAPPMPPDDMQKLKASGIGVFQSFMETYDPALYAQMHPKGPKRDYLNRLHALDVAMEAGFDDVGMGALFGLGDPWVELMATVAHARRLKDRFGAWPHTISVPRLRPAPGAEITLPPRPVSDDELIKLVAIYRLAIPTAGIVITTRERSGFREKLLQAGASQVSAGSRTDPGGYTMEGEEEEIKQFPTEDTRSLEEVVVSLAKRGHLPSLCTSCYRVGRTGEQFVKVTASGHMAEFCHENAILSLKEYLLDHAKDGALERCEAIIEEEISNMPEAKATSIMAQIRLLEKGKRDIHR